MPYYASRLTELSLVVSSDRFGYLRHSFPMLSRLVDQLITEKEGCSRDYSRVEGQLRFMLRR